jgi:hypothetical protein
MPTHIFTQICFAWNKSNPSFHHLTLRLLLLFSYCSSSCCFYYCCAGWEYIMEFVKVLTVYQICYTWIHPFHYSPLSPTPLIPEVSINIIFAFTCVCTLGTYFTLLSPFLTTNSPTGTNLLPPRQHLFHPPLFWFCRRKKEKNDIFAYLR